MNKKHGHLALFFANVIFGFNTPITRTIVPDALSPYMMTFFRMAGAAILFWMVSPFVKKEHVPKRDILLFFFASLFAIVLNQTAFIVGLSKTSPIDASLVITLLPIVTMLLSALILKEPITWRKTIGVLIGASGALILIVNSGSNNEGSSIIGNIIVLGSVTSFGLYLTFFRNLISRYSPFTAMKWMFLFAALITLPMGFKWASVTPFHLFDLSIYLRIGYVVALSTFITYMLIPIGQKTLRPTTVSMYNYLQPVMASILTIIIGLDRFGLDKFVSAVLVFLGVYIVTTSRSKADLK